MFSCLLKSKNFLSNSKSFFSCIAKNFKVEWNWMHFQKLCFPTIEVAAVHPIYYIIHSFFWRSSFGLGRLQNASQTRPRAIILIFLLFFIRSILRGKQSTKMNLSHRLHLEWKKLRELLILLKDIAVEKMIIVTIDQKSCKRIFICGSACICSSVFGLCCIYHYSSPGVLQVIAQTTHSTNWFKNGINNP